MNPVLAPAMIAAGGGLLAMAAIGYALEFLNSSAALAIGALGGVIDTLGAIAFVSGKHAGRASRHR